MPVNLSEPRHLLPVKGVQLGVASAGIKYADRHDVVVLNFIEGTRSSAAFTQNVFCAAPVVVAKQHLQSASPRALVINSGNANAVTGELGLQSAKQSCQRLADKLGLDEKQILPFSTGVIGEQLPMDRMILGIDEAALNLSENHWLEAAKAIMTTDIVAKAVSKQVEIDGQTVTVTGMAKGSGMICPNMATMLAYVVTDAKASQEVLDAFMKQITANSFNRATVDGDTSTNDAFVLSATQQVQNAEIDSTETASAHILFEVLNEVAIELAQAIVRDGEGATKFVEIKVVGGESQQVCDAVAYTVAHSPLVKTALFASDPNWGRLLMAIGRAETQGLFVEKISVSVNDLAIVTFGEKDSGYTEEKGQAVFNESELKIDISLGDSEFSKIVWTSDLSHEYVSINADYRS